MRDERRESRCRLTGSNLNYTQSSNIWADSFLDFFLGDRSSLPNNFKSIGSLPLLVGSAGSLVLSVGLVIFFSCTGFSPGDVLSPLDLMQASENIANVLSGGSTEMAKSSGSHVSLVIPPP